MQWLSLFSLYFVFTLGYTVEADSSNSHSSYPSARAAASVPLKPSVSISAPNDQSTSSIDNIREGEARPLSKSLR